MAKIAQLKPMIKDLEEIIALYEASEKDLKRELEKATAESTRLGKLLNYRRSWLEKMPRSSQSFKICARRSGGALGIWLKVSARASISL